MQDISILFAIEAEEKLLSGKIDEAIDLCINGLEFYPDYAVGYKILSLAYEELNDTEAIRDTVLKALNRLPNNKLIINYALQIINRYNFNPEDFKQRNNNQLQAEILTNKGQENVFLRLIKTSDIQSPGNLIRATNLSLIKGLAFTPLRSSRRINYINHIKALPEMPPFRKFFEDIANISDTKELPEYLNIENNEDSPGSLFVNETMAQIYVSQGAFDEAIEAYEQLMIQNPDKSDAFKLRIDEIKILKR